jgi:hypothetical protein
MEHMRLNVNNGISLAEFQSGDKAFFTFNLTPDYTLAQRQMPRGGNLRLDLKFEKPLDVAINVIVLGLYDATLSVTKERKIILS